MLKSFVAVAESRSFSAAARALHTVQPAISRQIADLESELGTPLFWRNTRSVNITPAGACLLQEARSLLAREAEARDRVQRAAHGEIGTLRIGYLPSACFSFLPTLVRHYTSQYPDVRVSLTEMNAREQIDAFAQDRLDVGFSRPLPTTAQSTLSAKPIYTDRLIAVLPAGHPLATARHLRLQDLARENFVLFHREGAVGLFDQIISACVKKKFTPRIASQPFNMQTVLTEIASGLGVSVVPGCIQRHYTEGCVFLPFTNLNAKIPLELHYRPAPSRAIDDSFVDLALTRREQIRELALAPTSRSPRQPSAS